MISVLTLIEDNRHQKTLHTQALFDNAAPLSQLQIGDLWLQKHQSGWRCSATVRNCLEWAHAWEKLHISALTERPETEGEPQEVVIQIADIDTALLWFLFDKQGLLKSPTGNWYLIPASLRKSLIPITQAQ